MASLLKIRKKWGLYKKRSNYSFLFIFDMISFALGELSGMWNSSSTDSL